MYKHENNNFMIGTKYNNNNNNVKQGIYRHGVIQIMLTQTAGSCEVFFDKNLKTSVFTSIGTCREMNEIYDAAFLIL